MRLRARLPAANKNKASVIEQRVTDGSSIEDFETLCEVCLTKAGKPISVKPNKELNKNLGPYAAEALVDEWLELCATAARMPRARA